MNWRKRLDDISPRFPLPDSRFPILWNNTLNRGDAFSIKGGTSVGLPGM